MKDLHGDSFNRIEMKEWKGNDVIKCVSNSRVLVGGVKKVILQPYVIMVTQASGREKVINHSLASIYVVRR